MIDIILSGCGQGIIWALLAIGFYIAFRILDFADMTCEGSMTLGGAVTAMLIWQGVNSFLAVVIAFIAGLLAGAVTGVLHTKLKIPPILSGILTMTALYSVNIHIMSIATGTSGTANLSLLKYIDDTVFAIIRSIIPLSKRDVTLVFGVIIVLGTIGLLYWFFGTEIGCAIRATGNNEKMCRAQGINTDNTKIIGLALANGLIAVAGSLLTQHQGYADVKMGVGSIVIGLASIIIGEALFARAKGFFFKLIGIAVGSVIYRVIVALVIYSGMPSDDLKLMSAVIVIAALAFTNYKNEIVGAFKKLFSRFKKKPEEKEEKSNE
ncbi:MAG: ABC transporter permease [Clostridia bacterium]|nr:ABC transporter permease [Clostridia bacterium]